jgi:hypothetical protein
MTEWYETGTEPSMRSSFQDAARHENENPASPGLGEASETEGRERGRAWQRGWAPLLGERVRVGESISPSASEIRQRSQAPGGDSFLTIAHDDDYRTKRCVAFRMSQHIFRFLNWLNL